MASQSASLLSLGRITTIASHTFTQLIRMKVFYFLIVFAIILWFFRTVVFDNVQGANSSVVQELKNLKSLGFFCMNAFSFILALTATALLIPKDLEDRTLYTILCKPVSRLDYLCGKYLGILSLIFVSLLCMDLYLSGMLYLKGQEALIATHRSMDFIHAPADLRQLSVQQVLDNGVNSSIHIAAWAIFLKAAIIAAIALLLSTISTSTIFTIILTAIVVIIGLIQSETREFMMQEMQYGQGSASLFTFSNSIAVIFPDLQLFGIDDGVINGRKIELVLSLKITLLAALYSLVYLVLAWFSFRKKEF